LGKRPGLNFLSHRYKYSARAGKRRSSVSDEHVIDHQQIAFLPGEAHCGLTIHMAYLFYYRIFYAGAVAVESIARQIVFLKK
jgi:hypothetical protein